MAETYDNIERPFGDYLEREPETLIPDAESVIGIGTEGGDINTNVINQSQQFQDLWIENELRSTGWKPKSRGFYMNGQTGYAEFSDVFISGDITANTGYIGGTEGWVISPGYIKDLTGTTGLSSVVTAGNDIRFWAGNADPTLAPFRVYENGDMVANSVTLTGYIATGGGEADVTSTLTQLSDLESNLGSITAGTITGALIRTSSSGSRVQLNDSTNTLQIYDSNSDLRAQSFSNGLEFYNNVGTAVGQLYIEDSLGYLSLASSNRDILISSTTSDIVIAAGGVLLLNVDGGTGNVHLINGADLVLGSTTIVGGGSWTLTLPPDNGVSGEVFTTDGLGNATWESAATAGADTDLGNLTTTSINTSLVSDTTLTDDLGSSSVFWDRLYIGDIYVPSGGRIRTGFTDILEVDTTNQRIIFGDTDATIDSLIPYTNLGMDLGTSSVKWNGVYCGALVGGSISGSSLSLTGDIDLNGNDITECDRISGTTGTIDFSSSGIDMIDSVYMNNNYIYEINEIGFTTGGANTAGANGRIAFYDSGTIQYRGQIAGTEYSFDLTAA